MNNKANRQTDEEFLDDFVSVLLRISEKETPEELKIATDHIKWAKEHIEEDPAEAKECIIAGIAAIACYTARIHEEARVRNLKGAYSKFLDAVKNAGEKKPKEVE